MIDKALLEEWQQLDAESSDLSRRKKTVDDRIKQIETHLEAELRASGRTSIIRHGFNLAWVPGRASVSWAAEYLAACGPEKVQALKDAAAAKASTKLQVSPPQLLSPTEE